MPPSSSIHSAQSPDETRFPSADQSRAVAAGVQSPRAGAGPGSCGARCSSACVSCASSAAISTNSSRFASPACASSCACKAPPPGVTLHELRAVFAAIGDQTQALVADKYRTLNEQVLPAMAAAGHPPAAARRSQRRAACVGGRLLHARSQAAADADRARSGASVSAGRQQEPQFHRRALGQRRIWTRYHRSRSSRRRACCRG